MQLVTTLVNLGLVLVACGQDPPSHKCDAPWNWCGWDLLRFDTKYRPIIIDELKANGKQTDDYSVNNGLFTCTDSGFGTIAYVQVCPKGCIYGGSGDSNDRCN
ncbi:hypothetical protein GGS26DRAFT_586343 [Hypomontagnella submonticulosa]|nr:hypothetical protein GGS26DRAFT_586343 [Hypomontagnella submonticulosa]